MPKQNPLSHLPTPTDLSLIISPSLTSVVLDQGVLVLKAARSAAFKTNTPDVKHYPLTSAPLSLLGFSVKTSIEMK
jgi:hypothetical protein